MKVLVRGINVSELDGWWAEAYEPDIGWALGDGEEHTDDRDGNEAEQLYSVLERGVIPESYSRHDEGIPNRLGGMDQGKHGSAIDPELLRESYGPRVYRATLPSGRCCIPIPYCK